MVKTWPFQRFFVTSNDRGSKDQIASPSTRFYISQVVSRISEPWTVSLDVVLFQALFFVLKIPYPRVLVLDFDVHLWGWWSNFATRQGRPKTYPPENEQMSPRKEPFQKERIVFQPHFRGELLVFGSVPRFFQSSIFPANNNVEHMLTYRDLPAKNHWHTPEN